jgi:hypothetical protein
MAIKATFMLPARPSCFRSLLSAQFCLSPSQQAAH